MFNNGIIEFVICREANLFFDVPERRFRKDAEMNSAEFHCRSVIDFTLDEEISRDFFRSALNLCKLSQRFECIQEPRHAFHGDGKLFFRNP